MKWIIFVMVTIIAFLMVICYSLLVVASEADERAEKYKEWKEKNDERSRQVPNR